MRTARARPAAFVEVDPETDGLPPGVRLRWFRSQVARPLVDAPTDPSAVPAGAIVWSDPREEYPEAAAVVRSELPREGPSAPSEPEIGAPATPTIREAVRAALEALPAGVRPGASDEVERALGVAGL